MPTLPLIHRQRNCGQCAIVALLLISASGCMSTAAVNDPGHAAAAESATPTALVVGLQPDPQQRRVWEDAMVQALERAHVQARPSYQIFSGRLPASNQLFAIAQALRAGPIYVSYRSDGDEQVDSARIGYDRFGPRCAWARYEYARASAYAMASAAPGARSTLETDLFAFTPHGRQLVWRGTTRDVDLTSPGETRARIEAQLVPMLRHENLLALR